MPRLLPPFVALLTLLVISSLACAADGCRALDALHDGEAVDGRVEDFRGFSYEAPPGWKKSDFEGLPMVSEPGHLMFAPNLLFATERVPGTLDDRVEANLPELRNFEGFEVVGTSEMETDDGDRVIRLDTYATHTEGRFRQIYYFIDGPEQFLGTCTRHHRRQHHADDLCDAAIRSFRRTGSREDLDPEVFDDGRGFRLAIPDGWTRDFSMGHSIVRHPHDDEFYPNFLVVNDEIPGGALKDRLTLNIRELQAAFVGFEIVDQRTMQTDQGREVAVLVTNAIHSPFHLRQTYYFIDSNQQYLVTTSRLVDDRHHFADEIFDAVVRSFTIH
jgi:hypothetical protein